jgi:hypothetical protein
MTDAHRQFSDRTRAAVPAGTVPDVAVPGGGPLLVAPDGTTIVLRPLARTDAVALGALYRHLPSAEWVSRLGVCEGHDRGFAARAASVRERGGRGLLAEVAPPSRERTDDRVVGEAHYELITPRVGAGGGAEGRRGAGPVGEVVLLVAPEWRDWLGPRLFDAILDLAAAEGLVNVEVDVMGSDTWMRQLLDARAHAVIPTDDWLATRMVLGADGGPPVWGTTSGPRVLVEAPDTRWHATAAAHRAGMAVMVHTGPADRAARCPLDAGKPCPLVAGADVVVISYPPERPEWDQLLITQRRLHPDVPVLVEGRAARAMPEGVVALDEHDPHEVVRRIAELAAEAHAR